MAFCCVSCEVLYIILFLFADEKSTSLLTVCRGLLKQSPLIVLVFISTLVGWAVKQVTNIIQVLLTLNFPAAYCYLQTCMYLAGIPAFLFFMQQEGNPLLINIY